MQTLKEGATLRHGDYRIVRVLGQGGFGITYLATDVSLDRLVAIKEFFPKDYCDRMGDTSQVTLGTQSTSDLVNKLKAKFLKEARNIARLDHPGIIRIHAAFEENCTAYYVMDYIEGCSISELVKASGPLKVEIAIAYVEKVADALEYLHSKRMNHLDIKPANIMVRNLDSSPVLIDFGLSKQYSSDGQETSTMLAGLSHGYAPIEQYNVGGLKEFSPQTDVYSLAATFYYMISGVVPPQATTIISDSLSFPGTIPTSFVAPLTKALKASRVERHESVKDFVEDLKKALESKSVCEETVIIRPAVVNNPASSTKSPTTDSVTPKSKTTSEPSPSSNQQNTPKVGFIENMMQKVPYLMALVVVALMTSYGIYECNRHVNGKNDSINGIDTDTVVVVEVFERLDEWNSPLGKAEYDGDLNMDNLPDGKGEATITDGVYKGARYEGEFKNGNFEGECIYTMANGDVFKGTFKANKYFNGRYTIKDSGEYFEGYFDNGQPNQGTWFDKNGHELETIGLLP